MRKEDQSIKLFTPKKMWVILIVLTTIKGISRYFLFPNQGWLFHLILFFTTFFSFMLLWQVIQISSKILENVLPLKSRPIMRIVTQVIIAFAFNTAMGFGVILLVNKLEGSEIVKIEKSISLLLYFWFAMILNLIHFSDFFFNKWNENYLLNERLKREKAEVRYDVLKNKLNPHFLFNALTSLNSLIFENQQLASDFLQQLSKVYRYTLQHKDKDTVSLKTELNFIDSYIRLFKIRFANAIDFKINVDEELNSRGIAPVTLQMLIENAVKHNVLDEKHPLVIYIHTQRNYLVVTNNINRKGQVETSNGTGLTNFCSFYQYLTSEPVVIENTGSDFIVKIPLI